MRILAIIITISSIFFNSCKEKENPEPTADCSKQSYTYSSDIKPLLENSCNINGCHNSGSTNGDYTTYLNIKAKVDNGTLKNRVLEVKDMPSGSTLSPDELKKFECWINSGATEN